MRRRRSPKPPRRRPTWQAARPHAPQNFKRRSPARGGPARKALVPRIGLFHTRRSQADGEQARSRSVSTFKAIVVDKSEAGQTVRLTDFDEKDLMDGDVTVAVEWSTVNYK